MNVNQKIEAALNNIAVGIWPLFCPEERPPDDYIVYNPEIEEGALYADDQDQEWMQHMQVHLFIKGNYLKKRNAIRKALREAEFIVTDITTLYEKDSGYNHLCFSCSTEENMED